MEEKVLNEEVKEEIVTTTETVVDSSIIEMTEDELAQEIFESEMKAEEDKWNALEAERDEMKNKWLYTAAELENVKKRFATERQQIMTNAMSHSVSRFLSVVDDFERAIKANESVEDINALKDGFNAIYTKFVSTLTALNVKKIDTTDVDFDTDYHEAVTTVPGDEEKKNKVIDCVETGYTLNGKVIRHAKVVVGA